MTDNVFDIKSFIKLSDIELKRAERYRIFAALILVDLSFVREKLGPEGEGILDALIELTRTNIRSSDIMSAFKDHIALLIPETPRQGAEITSRRLSEKLRKRLTEMAGQAEFEEYIPLEIASFPDTAGAKPMSDLLAELVEKHRN